MITPKALKNKLPLFEHEKISSYRQTIEDILLGKDNRLLLIVGPCSIHDTAAAYAYAKELKRVADEVEDCFFIVMRTYFEKARTALGWKGLIYDPNLDGSNNMQKGLHLARELLLALTKLGLPAATEFLEPYTPNYIADCISWGSIGARTCQSPIHRQIASNLQMPIGIKNRSDGNIDIAVGACITAKEAQSFLTINDEGMLTQVTTTGNPLPHIVLRGSDQGPNFDHRSIATAAKKLKEANLTESIIIDCSHDNSEKNYARQEIVFSSVIEQVLTGKSPIRGIMIESFLEAGAQSEPLSKEIGKSITDPCLDWQTTEALIREAAFTLKTKALPCAV